MHTLLGTPHFFVMLNDGFSGRVVDVELAGRLRLKNTYCNDGTARFDHREELGLGFLPNFSVFGRFLQGTIQFWAQGVADDLDRPGKGGLRNLNVTSHKVLHQP